MRLVQNKYLEFFQKWLKTLSQTQKWHMLFFESLFCFIQPRDSIYSRKCHYYYYYFFKMMILSYHLHLHQVFTILPLTSNISTTMNNQIEGVKALKFRFFLILSHFLSTQTTYLTLSLKIHPKNWRFWLPIM